MGYPAGKRQDAAQGSGQARVAQPHQKAAGTDRRFRTGVRRRSRLHRGNAALTTARGAINGIMAEAIEDHVQMHMVDEDRKPT